LAERRWYGAMFMEYMLHQDADGTSTDWTSSGILPGGIPEEPLCAARDCFQHEHDLMWKISNLVMGGGDAVNLDMLNNDEAVRRTVAEIILEARESDIQAAGHIERLLQANW
ncbi:MAG TPA: hypothetical protein VHR86_02280, partial [Armatimonadota bacterium]|nr:hypothetical protein [Armatimonadota bacterium]